MLTKLKAFFSSKKNGTEPRLPADFEQLVKKAIYLVENSSDDLAADEAFLKYLTDNGIEYTAAVEILLFLPIAFVRQLFPMVKWLETYTEFINEKTQIEKSYSETKTYQVILKVTTDYFANSPKEKTMLRIAGRSAEFNIINDILNNNSGSKIEDMELSSTIIFR